MLAIAVCIPVVIIATLLSLYRRKHGHYPRWMHSPPLSLSSTSVPPGLRSAPSRGLWRHSQLEGDKDLPGYTMSPVAGELSLGRGARKRLDTESEPRTSTDGRSLTTIVDQEDDEKDTTAREVLPPYVPPPPPVVLASSLGRTTRIRGAEAGTAVSLTGPRSAGR